MIWLVTSPSLISGMQSSRCQDMTKRFFLGMPAHKNAMALPKELALCLIKQFAHRWLAGTSDVRIHPPAGIIYCIFYVLNWKHKFPSIVFRVLLQSYAKILVLIIKIPHKGHSCLYSISAWSGMENAWRSLSETSLGGSKGSHSAKDVPTSHRCSFIGKELSK